jgi:hypothetical protein
MQEVKFKQNRTNNKIFRGWNRNMVACLNFIQMIQSFRAGSRIPTKFCRNVVASTKRPRDE